MCICIYVGDMCIHVYIYIYTYVLYVCIHRERDNVILYVYMCWHCFLRAC